MSVVIPVAVTLCSFFERFSETTPPLYALVLIPVVLIVTVEPAPDAVTVAPEKLMEVKLVPFEDPASSN